MILLHGRYAIRLDLKACLPHVLRYIDFLQLGRKERQDEMRVRAVAEEGDSAHFQSMFELLAVGENLLAVLTECFRSGFQESRGQRRHMIDME